MSSAGSTAHRVLHVVNRLGDHGDGIANVCIDLACQQSSDGDEVAIATALGGFTGLAERCGVRIAEIDYQSRNPGGLLRAVSRTRRAIREFAPDVVHAHTLVATVVARMAVLGSGVKVVATVHNEYQRGAIMMGAAHRVVGVSAAVSAAMQARRIPGRKISTVLNGVVGSVRRTGSVPPPSELATPALLAVGAVSERKGADLLVAMAARLAASHSAHLYFAGNIDWHLPAELAAQSANPEHIHFLGFESDPRRLLAAATVFVLGSRRDPAPLVLAEAMEAGLPIVATAVDGVPELLANGAAGVLVPPGDADRLADAVARLLDNGDERNRLAEAGRRRAAELGVGRVSADYRSIYRDLITRT